MTTLFKKKFLQVPSLSVGHSIGEIGKNPFVDWIVVLIVTVLVATVLIVGGAYLYWQVTTGVIQSSGDGSLSTPRRFDQKSLSAAIDRMEVKEAASAAAKRGYSGPSDPSL